MRGGGVKGARPDANGARLIGGPVGLTLWRLSWPTSLGLFSILAFNLIDTLYIGRLGPRELAAIGFCFPVIFSLGSVGFGLAAGATAVMSQAIGADDAGRMRATATNALILTLIVTSALALIGLATIDPLFRLLGAEPDVIVHVRSYMTVFYCGLPVVLAPVVINGIIRATGETILPAAVMVGGALMNAAVSPVLVFGLFGFPRLEMEGAAYGTLAARATMTIASIVLIMGRRSLFDFSAAALKDFRSSVGGVVAVGFPAIATQIITPLSSAVLTRLLSGYGQDTVAAFAVGARLEALFLIAFWALQGGLAPFVGQNYGARRIDRLKEAEGWIWRFSALWFLVALACGLSFGPQMASAFTKDASIATMSAHYFTFATSGFLGAGLMLASTAVFNSLSRPLLATGVVALRFIGLYIPLGWLFSRANGPEGVFAAATASYLVAGLFGAALLAFTLRRLSAQAAAAPLREDPPPRPHREGFEDRRS